jgi:hypothetical protein
MAESTRLKDLQADVKKMLELAEARHEEYLLHRSMDNTRMERLEANVGSLQLAASLTGSPSSTPVSQPPPPPLFQVRNVKLDFPRFDGSDVLQWIFKAEQFFDYYNTPDTQRLTIAAVHMDKDVVPWYQMLSRNHPFQSWVAFTRSLELEFGPSPFDSPRAHLFKLTQTTTVHEYYVTFTALANRAQGLTPDAILDCFISGLKPDLRRDVLAQQPNNMTKAISLAKLFEEKYTPKPTSNVTQPTSKPTYHLNPTQTTKKPYPIIVTHPSLKTNEPTKFQPFPSRETNLAGGSTAPSRPRPLLYLSRKIHPYPQMSQPYLPYILK